MWYFGRKAKKFLISTAKKYLGKTKELILSAVFASEIISV
jgi:hypothetical protein